MPLTHLLLALAVTAVWGTNFVVMKVAIGAIPPLALTTLRFALVLLPAVLLLRRPAVPWRELALYGVLVGPCLFGVLYLAMGSQITPGLASLVIQTQVFFTIVLAMMLARERLRPFQGAALVLAAAGLGVIVWHTDGSTTPLGLAMTLFSALSWAGGNLVTKRRPGVNMLAYVVWSALFAVPPLALLALWVEGWPAIASALSAASGPIWLAVLWQAVGNSLFGYAAWGWLLSRHPAASIAPMALLVPVFGMSASALWLGEPLPGWKLVAAALVMAGLAINVAWPRLAARRAAG